MRVTRRRFCVAGVVLTSTGLGGCLGRFGDDSSDNAPSDPDSEEWTWSGSLPVDAAVQYHDPGCGCCVEYVEYLEAHGIDVRIEEVDDPAAVKSALSVPDEVRSCHTIELGEYLIEGHVPLEAIESLFAEEPDVHGIAAPGMPQHSPGMGPRGEEPLQIYAFDDSGQTSTFLTV